ncbi:MAG: S1C family serine protease [Myxococcaceae bacterium]|nr:S1C family serine protease [Myxococcaceae bacterium]
MAAKLIATWSQTLRTLPAVLGLNTSGLLRGQSVTIPSATVQRVVKQLEAHGKIRRSYLGLTMQPLGLPEEVGKATGEEVGLMVVAVEPGGPSEQAGLRFGDTVLHFRCGFSARAKSTRCTSHSGRGRNSAGWL